MIQLRAKIINSDINKSCILHFIMNKHNYSFLDEEEECVLLYLVADFFASFRSFSLGLKSQDLEKASGWSIFTAKMTDNKPSISNLSLSLPSFLFLLTREYTRSIPALEYDVINKNASSIQTNYKIYSYFQLGFSCDKGRTIWYPYGIHHDPYI